MIVIKTFRKIIFMNLLRNEQTSSIKHKENNKTMKINDNAINAFQFGLLDF